MWVDYGHIHDSQSLQFGIDVNWTGYLTIQFFFAIWFFEINFKPPSGDGCKV